MKASDFIAAFLHKKGIKNVFELSGGMITHLLDSISQSTNINIISMHHEQAAAFAAEGCARITGLPGIAFATSGPGATNLLTGIGSCFFDSTPAIFITGQVNRNELKKDRKIRQLGFQETDILSMAKPITKATFLITKPNDIPEIFEKAFKIALEGRPGPVLIDIPMDVQRAIIQPFFFINDEEKECNISDEIIEVLIDNIKSSKKPLILAGRGIKASQSQKLFDIFKNQTKIPVITSLLGLDTIKFDDIQRVGFIGSYGNRWANIAFGECDLLIVLGSRMDIRQTGVDVEFIKKRKIFHVDCEEGEINNRVKGCIGILSDLNCFFRKFTEISSNSFFDIKEEWFEHIKNLKYRWPDVNELQVSGINPNNFIHALSSKSKSSIAFLADVGSHQMWTAQSLELYDNQYFLTSGGMGAMGFALPAAIGACIASDNRPIVVIIGDGCMQINIQELQTIVRNKLNIKIIVLHNKSLGMIRQFQDSYFESRYQSTFWGYDAPDFSKIAEAYQIESKTIQKTEEIDAGIEWMWNDENKPQLLQVMIEPNTNCYPKIAFGRPINEMEPFAKPIGMEST